MITLKEACKIASNYFDEHNLFIRNTCHDLGDSWIFNWGWKNAPDEIDNSGWLLRVSKNNGRILDFDLGVPGEKSFEEFMNATIIDITEHLTPEEISMNQVESVVFPSDVTVIDVY